MQSSNRRFSVERLEQRNLLAADVFTFANRAIQVGNDLDEIVRAIQLNS